jgi:hypothetical protein
LQERLKSLGEDLPLGEAFVILSIAAIAESGDDRFDQLLLILAIHDGESWSEADGLGMTSQDAMTDGVKGAAPESLRGSRKEAVDPIKHFPRGLVGKGE